MNPFLYDWNRAFTLRRLRWPLLLLLTGVIALLDQLHILTWDHAWPLYLILLGVLGLAERAAIAAMPPDDSGYAASGYPPAAYPGAYPGAYSTGAQQAPAWTQNPAQNAAQNPAQNPTQTEPTGLVPVSPWTSLSARPASTETQQNDSGEEHRS